MKKRYRLPTILIYLLFVGTAFAEMSLGLPINLGEKFEEEIGKWIKEGNSISQSVELLQGFEYECTSAFEGEVVDCIWTDRGQDPTQFHEIKIRLVGENDTIEIIYSTSIFIIS